MPPSSLALLLLVKLAGRSKRADQVHHSMDEYPRLHGVRPDANVYANAVDAFNCRRDAAGAPGESISPFLLGGERGLC